LAMYLSITPNNAINTDSEKRREKHAPLFTAGYGERYPGEGKTWQRARRATRGSVLIAGLRCPPATSDRRHNCAGGTQTAACVGFSASGLRLAYGVMSPLIGVRTAERSSSRSADSGRSGSFPRQLRSSHWRSAISGALQGRRDRLKSYPPLPLLLDRPLKLCD
jgi:hypothetical protein